jgi:uncharacterized membrane protein YsdA (DUF1294 family)
MAAVFFLLLLWTGIIAHMLISWLIAISFTAFIAYGFDKQSARSHWLRVPETVLIGLAFVGGTLGALLAMVLFHHKTSKRSFQWRFWLVVVLQVVVVGGFLLLASHV